MPPSVAILGGLATVGAIVMVRRVEPAEVARHRCSYLCLSVMAYPRVLRTCGPEPSGASRS